MHVIEGTVPRRRFISSIKYYNDYYICIYTYFCILCALLRFTVFHKCTNIHMHLPYRPKIWDLFPGCTYILSLTNFINRLSLCLLIFNRLIKYPLEINVADIDSCKFPLQRQILYRRLFQDKLVLKETDFCSSS